MSPVRDSRVSFRTIRFSSSSMSFRKHAMRTVAALVVAAPTLLLAGCDANTLLLVNDRNSVGTLGDKLLSLTEAIRLANGELSMQSLSKTERKRIRGGTPGGTSRDLIQIDIGANQTVAVSAPLPLLKNMNGDAIDGRGAILKPAADAGTAVSGAAALSVASSNFTITHLTLDGFDRGVVIEPNGVRDIHHVAIHRNRFNIANNPIGMTVAGGTDSIGTLRYISIVGNEFAAVPPTFSNVGISLNGKATGKDQYPTHTGLAEHIEIRDNTFGGGFFYEINMIGLQAAALDFSSGLTPGIASILPVVSGGEVRDVTIAGNRFKRCAAICLQAFGALTLGSNVAEGGMSGLRIHDNEFHTADTAIFLIAGYSFIGGIPASNTLSNVDIRRNTISGIDNALCKQGIFVTGTYTELALETASNNRVVGTTIASNQIDKCSQGITIRGGTGGWQLAGTVQNNAVTDTKITSNRFLDNELALHVAGGSVPGQGTPNGVTVMNNSVDSVQVRRNRFTTNLLDALIVGGEASNTIGSTVTANQVRAVNFNENAFTDGAVKCAIENDRAEAATANVSNNIVSDTVCPTL